MSKSTRIPHPVTGLQAFGYVCAIRELGTDRAPIYLLEGHHVGGGAGKGSGFGVKHIEAAHATEIQLAKCASVAEYVASLIYEGVPICSEGGFSSRTRVLALRHRGSVVVLEYRQAREEAFWSVITAFVRGNKLPAKELARIEPAKPVIISEITVPTDAAPSDQTNLASYALDVIIRQSTTEVADVGRSDTGNDFG